MSVIMYPLCKVCRSCAPFILPLILSGCVNGFHPGAFSFLLPEKALSMNPAVEEPAPHHESAGQSDPGRQVLPAAKDKRVAAVATTSPESPVPAASPASSRESGKPQQMPVAPPRRLAAVPKPDASFGETLLTEDSAWSGEVVITGVVTVAPQATLTILPGTVVRFGGTADSALLVQGRLAATGSKEKPVVFTSRFAEPAEGDWQGVIVLGSGKKNVLEHCLLEGAQVGIDATFSTLTLNSVTVARSITGIRVSDSVVSVAGGGANGCTTGMILADSEADLHDVVLSGNSRGLVMQKSSLYASGGAFTGNRIAGLHAAESRLKIAGSDVTANGAGMALISSQGSVSGCRIVRNSDYGVYLSGSRVKIFGNDIAKNGTAGLKVEGGTGAAWGNSFAGNGSYDLVNAGSEDFTAMGNWWGGVGRDEIGGRIFDRQEDARRGRVLYLPVMTGKPAVIP